MSHLFFRGGLLSSKAKLVLAFTLALALIVPAAFSTANAQDAAPLQPSGKFCVDGLVIDWQENAIEEGWTVVATPYIDGALDPALAIEALPSEEDDEEGMFFFEDGAFEDDLGLISTDWQFEILFDGFVGDWEPVTSPVLDASFDYGQDSCQRIRFKLREIVSVLVIKIDADHNLLEDWTIVATPAKGNFFAETQDGETNENGEITFRLTPGTWIFTEESPDDVGSNFYPVIPVTGEQQIDLISAADRADDDNPDNDFDPAVVDYVIRFKNMLDNGGCLEIYKTDVPPEGAQFDVPFPLAGWEISVLRADGTEEIFGYTDATGYIKFEGLPYGPYSVKEESRVGWEAVTPSSFDVTLSDSTCQIIEFKNEQAPATYCIEGQKLDANGHYGLPDWKIEATPLSKNGYEPEDVYTDGLGNYKFVLPGNDYRVPGSKYKVCEEDKDGWLPHTSSCFTVTVPKTPGACVEVPDFVNQQVGHSESGKGKTTSTATASSGWSNMGNMGGMSGMGGMDMKCSSYHKVMKGEGLYDIGAANMKPAGAMLAANPWVSSRPNHYLYPGDTVCIP